MKTILIFCILFFVSYSVLSQEYNTPIPYRKGKQWGYASYDGKILIPPRFDYAEAFNIGFAEVHKKIADSLWAQSIIDTTGELMVPLQYSEVYFIELGKIDNIISKASRNQMRQANNQTSSNLHYKYDSLVHELSYRTFYVWNFGPIENSKMGVYNKALNRVVIPTVYDGIKFLTLLNNRIHFVVQRDTLMGLIDDEGNVVYGCNYYNIYLDTENDENIVLIKDKEAWLNDSLEKAIKYQTEEHIELLESRDRPFRNDISTNYDELKEYRLGRVNDLFLAREGKDWGILSGTKIEEYYVDSSETTINAGQIIVPINYECIRQCKFDFKEAIKYTCVVKKKGVWQIINESSKQVVPFEFKNEPIFEYLPGTDLLTSYFLVLLQENQESCLQSMYFEGEITGIFFIKNPERKILNVKRVRQDLIPLYYHGEILYHPIFVIYPTYDVSESYYVNHTGFKYMEE